MKLKELLLYLDGSFAIHIQEESGWLDLDRDLNQDDSIARIREVWDSPVTRVRSIGDVCHINVE